jgi:hypothetical protein
MILSYFFIQTFTVLKCFVVHSICILGLIENLVQKTKETTLIISEFKIIKNVYEDEP